MSSFGSRQLNNMVAVGSTGPRSVRLWFRAEVAGEHEVALWPLGRPAEALRVRTTVVADDGRDNTHTLRFPDDFPGAGPLQPLARYQYRVHRVADGTPLGEGRFETAPETPEQTPDVFSFALMSCHQPFNSDGELSERSMRMLRLAPKVLAEHDAKFIIASGDQIYADAPADFSLANPHYLSTKVYPHRRSLLECSADEVRRAYQARYRTFWALNEVRHVYANYPCYPILDDHEIVDDWGSLPAHGTRAWSNVFSGARAAYADYQGTRVAAARDRLPASLHYDFCYGSVAVFVLDLRSERRVGRGNGIYSKTQYNALRTFLRRHRDKDVIAIVSSVPVVHLPSWLTDVGASLFGAEIDFPDHWSFHRNLGARNTLLNLIHAHQQQTPGQRVLLLSGDVHIGCAFAIHWKGGNKPILYQLTSSAISNRLKKSEVYFSRLGPKLSAAIRCGDACEGEARLIKRKTDENNPFGGLNLGIVEVHRRGAHSTVTFKLIGYPPDEQWKPQIIFSTGEL